MQKMRRLSSDEALVQVREDIAALVAAANATEDFSVVLREDALVHMLGVAEVALQVVTAHVGWLRETARKHDVEVLVVVSQPKAPEEGRDGGV